MRLYGVTISAVRDKGGEKPECMVQNSIALLYDDNDVENTALDYARDALPESDGWIEHQAAYTEIASGMVFADRYRLIWSIEDARTIH